MNEVDSWYYILVVTREDGTHIHQDQAFNEVDVMIELDKLENRDSGLGDRDEIVLIDAQTYRRCKYGYKKVFTIERCK